MKGIIIAAGYGSRLKALTANTPKSLVQIDGKSIITYPIDALAAAGISDISIVPLRVSILRMLSFFSVKFRQNRLNRSA